MKDAECRLPSCVKRRENMEWLDVVDDQGNPTGETVERTKAHQKGIRHRTAHVWLMREHQGKVEILLQKRSAGKDSHPGCYDISGAGHIPAGVDWLSSARRELLEELGLKAEEKEFVYCGQRKIYWKDNFYGKLFVDNQISNVYCLWRDVEPEQLKLQPEEVEEVCWMSLDDCREAVCKGSIPNCISMEELEMLPRTFKY